MRKVWSFIVSEWQLRTSLICFLWVLLVRLPLWGIRAGVVIFGFAWYIFWLSPRRFLTHPKEWYWWILNLIECDRDLRSRLYWRITPDSFPRDWRITWATPELRSVIHTDDDDNNDDDVAE